MERLAKHKRQTIAFTEGGVFGKIVLFALPIMFTNVLQILFNAADMIVVGQFSGVDGAVGAVGSTGPIVHLIINLMVGVAVGANVVVANTIGARDEARTRRAVHSALTLGLLMGLACMVVGLCLSKQMLLWMNADESLLGMSLTYLRIYFLGVPFAALVNYTAAVFRAKGDTRTPMIVMTLAGVLNVLLNLFFVIVCGMNVDGVALATMIANMMSALVLLVLLSRAKDATKFSLRALFSLDGASMHRMLAVGIPAGLQGCMFSLSNVFIQSAVNGNGPAVIDANAITAQLDGIIFTATNAFHQAALTFVGQNIGASRYDRLGKIARGCYAASLSVSVLLVLFIYSLRVQFIHLYINADATDIDLIVKEACIRVGCSTVFCAFQALMDTGSGLMRAMNRSMTAFLATLVGTCLFRVVWIYTAFAYTENLRVLYYSFPISWLATGLVLLAFVIRTKNKLQKAHAPTPVATATT